MRNYEVTGRVSKLVDVYLTAKEAVIDRGFAWEVDWQADIRFDCVKEQDFLRETAWTILSAGFRESVVRKIFGPISKAFFGWCSAAYIHSESANCRQNALKVFGNERKIGAILKIADIVDECGFKTVYRSIGKDGVQYLQTLPYIGSITAFHLAKNLGLPVVKPDRHLQRIAEITGSSSPHELCELIAERVGDPISVIDVVLWRYATLFSNYLTFFGSIMKKERLCLNACDN